VGITKQPPNVLSLCSGYGGIEKGIRRAIREITLLAHVEIEAFAIANLVDKMETGEMAPTPIWTDLKTFNATPFRGHVDILTGGYPCQPFSVAGARRGTEDPRHLWPYIVEIIRDCEPRRVFFENVEGHLSLGISEVLEDLENLGYRVEVGIFSAAEVGAPHQRKRVFILGDSVRQRAGGRLADCANSDGGLEQIRRENPLSTAKSGADELGNSQGDDKRRSPVATMHREGIEIRGPGGNVVYRNSSQGGGDLEPPKLRTDRSVQSPGGMRIPCETTKNEKVQTWPAKPGKPQHEWEEPRIVVDS